MVFSDNMLDKVRALIEPIVLSEGMELTDLEFKKGGGRWFLRIFIDKDGGVTLDDCTNISHQVGEILEVEDVIKNSYTLEVSSPGLDRPLRRIEDYHKFVGKLVKVTTNMAIDGKKSFLGKLKAVEGLSIILEKNDGDILSIPFSSILKGRLEVEL